MVSAFELLRHPCTFYRRLYAHGRKEKAVKSFAMLHSRDRDPYSPLIQLEIQEIEENMSVSSADKSWGDFRAYSGREHI